MRLDRRFPRLETQWRHTTTHWLTMCAIGNQKLRCRTHAGDRTAASTRLSRASGFCPWAASRTAHWWPSELPADGHWFCPVRSLVVLPPFRGWLG